MACPKRPDFQEALGLCETAGLEVVEVVPMCRRPHPATYVGPGRLERIKELVEEKGAEVVVVYGNPKPSQIYRIMRDLKVEVIDRTSLILKIFELHAGSEEAKLQTELARLKYELTMAREYIRTVKKGEQVFFLGPGEYAVDYVIKAIHRRMKKIEDKLERIRKMREQQKSRRLQKLKIPEIAIAGYTCAGKTALLNSLSKLRLKEGAEMFTTVLPKHARVWVDGEEGIFVDTVGFIESVPPQIVEAFHATLSEIAYSDAVILVIDSSESKKRVIDKTLSSLETLANIGVIAKPLIVALNKVDLAQDWQDKAKEISEVIGGYYDRFEGLVPISAKTGYNVKVLAKKAIQVAKRERLSLEEVEG
ncbi:GTP-binding protein HflX [Ignicoccus pacificus DSM 13166]|uniref:GTPase HflX n=1 Tax=Ignicoccus pacificus DSM 13166 TaxID=940294 RepID=A0A977PJX7_9CREN|nr:GTP-binding protein HflX [Ignicoccus pacificus DSM 13166]